MHQDLQIYPDLMLHVYSALVQLGESAHKL